MRNVENFLSVKHILRERVQVKNQSERESNQVQPKSTEKEQPFISQSFYYATR